MTEEYAPKRVQITDECIIDFLTAELKKQVDDELLNPDFVKVNSVLGVENSSTGFMLWVSVYNPVKNEWSKGGVNYTPNWCDTSYNFSPLGNIYSIFDWILNDPGATYRKNNPTKVPKL